MLYCLCLVLMISGGPTYCALASIFLAGKGSGLTDSERKQTIRWLTQNQVSSGGYCGRTNKEADACYCFWCGASLAVSFDGALIADFRPLKVETLLDPWSARVCV